MKFAKPHKHKFGKVFPYHTINWVLRAVDKASAIRAWDYKINIPPKCPRWTRVMIKDIPF